MIVELAERDATLFRKLDLASMAALDDPKAVETRLRKAIDAATRTRDYVYYREVPGWAADVDAVLDSLDALIPGGRAVLALGLAERAIDRIERAIEDIDDSDGECSRLLDRAGSIHLAAAHEVRPEPVSLARALFRRELNDAYGAFGNAVTRYANVLGEDGLAEYRRLASDAWQKLPPMSGGGARYEDDFQYARLIDILDFFAARDGDVEARIALRAKDLTSPWKYLQLAQFCLEQGREAEALRRAEDGLWLFEDQSTDERLLLFAVELLLKAGRQEDAEARLWSAFRKQPGISLYERLRTVGGTSARDRAVELLQKQLTKEKASPWHYPADLLVRILIHEQMYEAAWAIARRYGTSISAREALARASETAHPREALETYAERVDQLVDHGGNPAYEEASRLVARMAQLRDAAEQGAYILTLKARFGRKRNFMKLLV